MAVGRLKSMGVPVTCRSLPVGMGSTSTAKYLSEASFKTCSRIAVQLEAPSVYAVGEPPHRAAEMRRAVLIPRHVSIAESNIGLLPGAVGRLNRHHRRPEIRQLQNQPVGVHAGEQGGLASLRGLAERGLPDLRFRLHLGPTGQRRRKHDDRESRQGGVVTKVSHIQGPHPLR